MIQPLVTNEFMLKVPARPATKDDIIIADDRFVLTRTLA